MSQIMLIYPPGKSFQRGEERCQIDIDNSAVNSKRACNDLGYAAAVLKKLNHTVFLRDYQVENLALNHLLEDVKNENPDVIFISITNGSIYNDLKIISEIKKIKKDIIFILKGALFFNPEDKLFEEIGETINEADYLIGGEQEFIIGPLINAHYNDKNQLKNIQGISYKENGKWINNYLTDFCENIDGLPFPDRSLMKNDLYINPATNKPMALITTAKGCCFSCFYCLSSVISGKKVRNRSNQSIFAEMTECYKKYNIKEFFLKSDTFTVDKKKVIDLCSMIINSELNGKINWYATARVDTLDDEMLGIMKESGCSLLSIGFESGSNESLKRMKKGTSTEKNLLAAKLCKKHGIKMLGHFLIGFEWEDESHLAATKKHIFDLNADFIEISVIIPYYKTELYEEIIKQHNENLNIIGFDSYNNVYEKYHKIPAERLQKYRKQLLREYYLRPKYIISKILDIKRPAVFMNYIKYGIRMLKNTFY